MSILPDALPWKAKTAPVLISPARQWFFQKTYDFFLENAASNAALFGAKIQFADEGAAFRRAVNAIHSAIFPFDRERAAIADVVQRDDDVFKFNVAVAERAEIPEAARVGEIRVAAEHADRAVTVSPPNVFHVRVENAVAEFADEFHITHALIAEVRRIVN